MKQFKEIDPLTVALDPDLVATLIDKTDLGNTFYFLIKEGYLIIADAQIDPDDGEWLHYQIEFPKQGLSWFLDTLEGKFYKTEAEGGLPKGTFNTEGTVQGERLKLRRAFNADGQGGGGYAFVTLDRKEKESVWSKSYTFTDSLLFEHGLMNVLKDLATRIKNGQI